MKRLLLTVPLVLALLACGSDPKLTEGEVIDKSVTPERTTYIQTCVAYGKYGCQAWIPMPIHHDAEWLLLIDGEADGDSLQEWHEVSVELWNETEPGDWWEATR